MDNEYSISKFLDGLKNEIEDLYNLNYLKIKEEQKILFIPSGFNAKSIKEIYDKKLNKEYPLVDNKCSNERMIIDNVLWDLFYYEKDDKYSEDLKINLDKLNFLYKDIYNKFICGDVRYVKAISENLELNDDELSKKLTFYYHKNNLDVNVLVKYQDYHNFKSIIQSQIIDSLNKLIVKTSVKLGKFSIGFVGIKINELFKLNMRDSEKVKKIMTENNLKIIYSLKNNSIIISKLKSNLFKSIFNGIKGFKREFNK